jgi:hypothetical protein
VCYRVRMIVIGPLILCSRCRIHRYLMRMAEPLNSTHSRYVVPAGTHKPKRREYGVKWFCDNNRTGLLFACTIMSAPVNKAAIFAAPGPEPRNPGDKSTVFGDAVRTVQQLLRCLALTHGLHVRESS